MSIIQQCGSFSRHITPKSAYELAEKANLAPKNSHVYALIEDTLRRLHVENEKDERVFKSVDEAIIDNKAYQLYMPTEYLNSTIRDASALAEVGLFKLPAGHPICARLWLLHNSQLNVSYNTISKN